VHLDWSAVCAVEVGLDHREGVVKVMNANGETIFRFYNFSGAFPEHIQSAAGSLV
jgi:hypothetical protein